MCEYQVLLSTYSLLPKTWEFVLSLNSPQPRVKVEFAIEAPFDDL